MTRQVRAACAMWSVMSDQTKTLKTACRCAQFCMLRMSMCVVSYLFTLSTMVSMNVLKVYLSLYTLLRSHLFVNCCIRRYSIYSQCTLSGRRNAAFPASELCTEHGKHHPAAIDGAIVLPVSRRQSDVSTDGDVVHQHDRTGPEDSHGCKLGRSRIRVVGFWLRLDVQPNQIC